MYEFSIRLADFCIRIRTAYDETLRMCTDYLCSDDEQPDLTVAVPPEAIAAERETATPDMTDGYLESICVYRAICRALPPLGGMLLHAALISDGKQGFAFTADSGTGKTTHIRLWQKAFGKEIKIINGDKPLLRRRDGAWYAYGTPWCGKEGWHINACVPLAGICFLRRGETNILRPYPIAEVVTAIFSQIVLPEDPIALTATLELLDDLVSTVPFYELHCTISEEAAHVARRGMTAALPAGWTETEKL